MTKAWRWQDTRSRIASVKFKDDDTIVQLQACDDFCWQMLWDLRDMMASGRLQSLGVVAVTVDRSTLTAYSIGDGMYSALSGGAADLQHRLMHLV